MPFRGVFYRGKTDKTVAGWRAQINRGSKRRYSPAFASEIAAAQWVSEQLGNHNVLDLKKDSSEAPVVKAARRFTGKTRTRKVSLRLWSKGPRQFVHLPHPMVTAKALVRQEQSLRVTAEARARELEEELAQGKAEVELARRKATYLRELEDTADWLKSVIDNRMPPHSAMMRRRTREHDLE